ncbi:hypothetical protein RvY_19055-2 [Ramazzottius varieornatus]|uniref:Uncharacterized protein n=1 Tax=Ramazzottius varieornatus TaxID=947166 RepID=A0A1D1WC09_RAMVA|nr:hypothetical protein RvY_19055-2 [Ramazzottius varieornatus]
MEFDFDTKRRIFQHPEKPSVVSNHIRYGPYAVQCFSGSLHGGTQPLRVEINLYHQRCQHYRPLYNIWIKSAQTSGFVDRAGVPMTLRHYSIDTKNFTTESIDAVVNECAKYSRVFILSMTEGYVRRILVQATKLGIKTSEFVSCNVERFHGAVRIELLDSGAFRAEGILGRSGLEG